MQPPSKGKALPGDTGRGSPSLTCTAYSSASLDSAGLGLSFCFFGGEGGGGWGLGIKDGCRVLLLRGFRAGELMCALAVSAGNMGVSENRGP